MTRYLAEFVGSFGLVFAGCGAIVINTLSGGRVTHVGIGLTFGLVVAARICQVFRQSRDGIERLVRQFLTHIRRPTP